MTALCGSRTILQMPPADRSDLDAVIFGGGAAGLWILDELRRAGYTAVLLESNRLGSGQTIASQGIIHGGVKYTLGGILTPSANAIREMPLIWRRCLAGEREPALLRTRLRAEHCYLWRTASFSSKLAMIGAKAGLRVTPIPIDDADRPPVLEHCPGTVARLDEQVIDPASFLHDLADRNRGAILSIDASSGLEIDRTDSASPRIRLLAPDSGRPLDLHPRWVVLTAGQGNAALRAQLGLDGSRHPRRSPGIRESQMQLRPLKMVLACGRLPILNGHCVDGATPRVTITTSSSSTGATIWQIGGEIAETGVEMADGDLLRFAKSEVESVLPGVDLSDVQWATSTADRAESKTRAGLRPDDATVLVDGCVVTIWPTKLALAPRCGSLVLGILDPPIGNAIDAGLFDNWPRPRVALPPWEEHTTWHTVA